MKQGDNINYDVDATYDMTIIIIEKNISPTIHWMCYIITTFLTKSQLHEESSIYKNMLYQKPKAYAVHFLERGYWARPHTYIGATTYAVHFFQRGCFAHHKCWITKAGNTKPHIRIQLQQPPLYISSSEAIVHTHIRILVQQPMLYISSSEAVVHSHRC